MGWQLIGLILSGVAGAWLARLARVPMWPMTGAVIGAGSFHLLAPGDVRLPPGWVFLAQVAVGTSVGSRLGRSLVRDFRRVVLPGVLVMTTVVPAGIGMGLLLARMDGIGELESTFGMVPGGVGEMVAAVTALGGDSAVVAAMHLVRLLVVIWTIHLMGAWLRSRDGDSQ